MKYSGGFLPVKLPCENPKYQPVEFAEFLFVANAAQRKATPLPSGALDTIQEA